MTFKETVATKAKAVLAGGGILLAGFAEWLVQNPDTATAIEKVVPAPWDQLVPIVLGGASTWLVHRVPNADPVVAGADNDDELVTNTTAITTVQTEDGVAAGDGR